MRARPEYEYGRNEDEERNCRLGHPFLLGQYALGLRPSFRAKTGKYNEDNQEGNAKHNENRDIFY